ncbi:aldo/keto reductase [Serratia rubidaea]|uniref:Oxidoreductase YdhF n=1 Tax=Serratia rubidaea TaxID=61652 RepID=A0A3S4X4K0_SERRU|nr:aldo/keto reductase family oxidoreductase [Serratia rubidaea]MDC6119335.1 aldo/keto reductase family oxidoreductase [Serratia rubidaea]MEB7584779.1 aldo/keto reductase family oxidoreductase [Serratia rubidaea]VEI70956.1 Oxidoreductase YdhF [Serratia rubidaea]
MGHRIHIAPQGPEFSRMVCGYWRLMEWGMSPQQLLGFIEQHLELGITTVDHADIYGGYACEQAFGDALRLRPALRQRLELVSKCGIATTAKPGNPIGHYITDRDHIVSSAEQSLHKLHTDYLDLLLIHRPDPLMEADEVAEAFVALHKSGKVRHFGVSNFTPSQFTLLQSRLPFSLVTNQVEISPLHQPALLDGTLDQCQQLRIRPMAWSCLGGGRLFSGAECQPLRDELQRVAQETGAETIEQVVYAWVMRLPSAPLPIIGSGKIERVKSALGALQLTLSREQWFRIRKAALGYDVP